ncbi:MAG: UDP-N-acetylmuramoyl-tripeptide--D-alanyl-D-alanine ligase [Clostridia bacterium]
MEYLALIIFSAFVAFSGEKNLHIIQLDGYKIKYNRRNNKQFLAGLLLCFAQLFCNVTYFFAESKINANYSYFCVFVMCLTQTVLILTNRYSLTKIPLKITKRIVRIFALSFVLFLIEGVILLKICQFIVIKQNSFACFLLPLLNLFGAVNIYASIFLLSPIEKLIVKYYKNKAIKQLNAHKLIKIGITGSYGKTSVKNILATILKQKYNVLATPQNYNTPLGICKSLSELTDKTEVFIGEFGAKNVGDIKELCNMVNPTIAIITAIGRQHLQTFKTEQNIYNTKKELIDCLPQGSFAVFNGENALATKMFFSATCNKQLVVLKDKNNQNYTQDLGQNAQNVLQNSQSDIFADNIKTSAKGVTFSLHIKNNVKNCHTKLLGEHNIVNILLAVAVANFLQVDINKIMLAINQLEPTPHRLELLSGAREIAIIDDTYNSNIDGFKKALAVLESFEGKKVLITPSLVELGKSEQEINQQLAQEIAKVCQLVVLVGQNSKCLMAELKNIGFSEYLYYESLQLAQKDFEKILNKGDVVLMENDLPDNY